MSALFGVFVFLQGLGYGLFFCLYAGVFYGWNGYDDRLFFLQWEGYESGCDSLGYCLLFGVRVGVYMKKAPGTFVSGARGGGYLLSRLRSTIGVIRFNFSVRYG